MILPVFILLVLTTPVALADGARKWPEAGAATAAPATTSIAGLEWYARTSWQLLRAMGIQPGPEPGATETDGNQMHRISLDAGLGSGPRAWGPGHWSAGYDLRLFWDADAPFLDIWADDPADLDYLPLAPYRSERRHRLYAEYDGRAFGHGLFGLRTSWQWHRMGSQLMPGPEEDRRENTATGHSVHGEPRIGVAWDETWTTTLGLVFQKVYYEQDKDLSRQSWWPGGAGRQRYSWYLEQQAVWQTLNLHFNGRFVDYHWIHNSVQDDYNRRGILLRLSGFFGPWGVHALYGGFTDTYEEAILASGSCAYSGADAPMKFCTREDLARTYRLGGDYLIGDDQSLGVIYGREENRNDQFPVYDYARDHFLLSWTIGIRAMQRRFPFELNPDDAIFSQKTPVNL